MAKQMSNNKPRVLIVDDEPGICELLMEILSDEGYRITVAHNGAEAHAARLGETPDIILLDIWMPDTDGISLIRRWKDEGLMGPPVIVMSGHGTIDTAVEATQLGAAGFLEKPISNERLLSMVKKVSTVAGPPLFSPVIQDADFGKSDAMRALKDELLRASAHSENMLFVCPADAGAPFFAGLLTPPGKSMRTLASDAPLMGDPMELLKQAAGGLVLVTNLDLMEAAELRGIYLLATKAPLAKARLVAHSGVEPEELARTPGFDGHLLRQFHKAPIRVPPFSEFSQDIPELSALVNKQFILHNETAPRRLTSGAVNVLVNHTWDGNFSQFVKAIRNAMMCATTDEVDEATMRAVLARGVGGAGEATMYDLPLREAREHFEREYFRRLLVVTNGNVIEAAQKAGLERTYLYRKLKYLEIEGIEPC